MKAPEVRQLRAFVYVAEELSFTAAAERLPMSQQALSRTIAALERQLDCRLFDRDTHGVELTDAGARLLPWAYQVLTSTARLVAAAEDRLTGPPAELVVDVSSAGLDTGAAVIRSLRDRFPDVAVRQIELGVRGTLRMMRRHEADAVIGIAPTDTTGLRVLSLRRERVLVGMRGDHELAHGPVFPARALGDQPLLLPSSDTASEWLRLVQGVAASVNVKIARYRHTTHGSVAAAQAVREGDCVVPTTAWAEPPDDLVFLPLDAPAAWVEWSLIHLDQQPIPPQLAALIESAQAVAGELGWRDW